MNYSVNVEKKGSLYYASGTCYYPKCRFGTYRSNRGFGSEVEARKKMESHMSGHNQSHVEQDDGDNPDNALEKS